MINAFTSPLLHAGGGAKSGPVRISYFDPRTGEPCDSKPEPLHEPRSKRPEWGHKAYAASCERGRKKRPVVVDGELHESIRAAARAMGWNNCGLNSALKSGKGEFKGHSVAYADDERS